jgi:hypothetical protein
VVAVVQILVVVEVVLVVAVQTMVRVLALQSECFVVFSVTLGSWAEASAVAGVAAAAVDTTLLNTLFLAATPPVP